MPSLFSARRTTQILVALISCALVASFFLHTVQTKHAHPGNSHAHEAGQEEVFATLGEYLHASEKKLFLLVLLGFLFFGAFVVARAIVPVQVFSQIARRIHRCLTATQALVLRQFSYMPYLFSSGILHSRLCD